MLCGLVGCTTLGPDYQEPEVAWLSDWQTDLYGLTGDAAGWREADLRFWWRLFDDRALNRLIETARRDNPTLRIASLRILESQAALGIAEGGRFPQLQEASGAVSYVDTHHEGGSAGDRDQSFRDTQAGFTVGWELDFWGRYQRAIESADAAFFGSITAQQDVQVLLTAQVSDLYFGYRTTEQRIHIAQSNAAIQRRSLEITENLFHAGQGSELDVQQAKTQYLATLSNIPQLEATLVTLRNGLAAVLGRAPGAVPELVGGRSDLPSVDEKTIRDVPARLLIHRPDIRSAAWKVAAQSAQIGIAKADYYPAISLLGSIGWSGDSLSATPNTATFIAGPRLNWNVFDYGRTRNNVRLQDARLQETIEAFQDTVLQAAREIDDAAVTVVKTAEQQVILDDALHAAERSLKLANTRYQEGYSDFQRVLDAQRALFAQAEQQTVTRGAHISALIALYQAFGGGWLEISSEDLLPGQVRDEMRARTPDWGNQLHAPLPVIVPAVTGSGTTP